MPGFFSQHSIHWLLQKLQSELDAMRQTPLDPMVAFDFFVTAESAIDWLAPGRHNKKSRESLRAQHVVLQTASQIASSAKHFVTEAKHHVSVRNTYSSPSLFSGGLFAGRLFAGNLFPKGELMVELENDAAKELGERMSAIALAEAVLTKLKELVAEKENHGAA